MTDTISTIILSIAAAVPSPGFRDMVKPPLADVKIMPHRIERVDGDYTVEVEGNDADERYAKLKRALDERFSHMFELKERIDGKQGELDEMREEYFVLREKYNRELRKIIAAWVTESNYDDEKTEPMPRIGNGDDLPAPVPHYDRKRGRYIPPEEK